MVDLNKMRVINVEDHGVVPMPPNDGNYAAEFVKEFRTDLKPLDIVQPEGPSFKVNGNEVSWQKWNFRVGFTRREGLVLHAISYQDKGRRRPIIYRASLGELVVPYGDPAEQNFRKNAFDVGEAGIGSLANSLTLGCDCLGQIHYFDAVLNDSRGEPVQIPNAVCLHEEDFGILWKHTDWRTGQAEVRRSRRLVISFIATVGNYEYGFFWHLYQDGTIEFQVKLTGIVNNMAMAPGESPKYGSLIAPQLGGHIHQHFFNVRLDMGVDGTNNSVYEVNTKAEPMGPGNPQGNAFFAEKTLLATESEAQRTVDPLAGRYWLITNPSVNNYLGQPVSYKLVPGENVLPFAHAEASVSKRAAFINKHLWVTPYSPDEMAPAGPYPNQHPGGAGLPEWTKANRNVENTDIVVWYNFGTHHVPRPERLARNAGNVYRVQADARRVLRSEPGFGRSSLSPCQRALPFLICFAAAHLETRRRPAIAGARARGAWGGYSSCRSRGSRVSRSQSPNRFRAITVNIMATPGRVEIHHATASLSLPSETMEPQAGVGGGTPAPRKLSVDSTSITIPT